MANVSDKDYRVKLRQESYVYVKASNMGEAEATALAQGADPRNWGELQAVEIVEVDLEDEP